MIVYLHHNLDGISLLTRTEIILFYHTILEEQMYVNVDSSINSKSQ